MPALICPGCGHANGPDARFCEECGGSLAPCCPSCGAEVSATARFCSSCGSPIAAEAASTGALKVVSVVFSDVVGSTELQEKLEAESVRRVMARFYEAMREVVERYGGAIQKFIGDAAVAVFGVPSVGEDDAVRAVRCAAAMTAALESLNDELESGWGVRVQIRTGVNTGELAISDEGIFVGDTMNTAARLEQAADAGQVLLGEATWRVVRQEVEVEEMAPLELKGKAGPIRVWRLVSVQPRGAAAAEAPLVGRVRELERLRACLEQATAARTCRLVTVIGSPGLGKSRLATEFARALEGQASVLEGHCERSGEGITFLPVADVLRAAASIADDDPPEQVVAKLTETVREEPDRDRIVARVAGLLGAAPPAAPEETFWGVRSVLESLARERPLVVVLDDVHWGQPMFLDLIEHLVEWARDAAILLVALARPELRETREALAHTGRRAVDVIELEPLEPDQSRELVGGLLGQVDLPDELLGRILERTGGNPLFLGELLRMLVDEGSLEQEGEVWVAAGGAETVQVPPTIQALLTARIERLRADERSVVERAAVIGKQFYRGAVAELVAPPIRSGIDGHLETLRRKEMVEPEGTYWIDEPVYRFHHVLIRDAAYHLLLKEARAELHEKFADWLETKAGELVGEHEEVIAYHLEQAHEYRRQLGPLDDRGQAIGTRAAAMFASAGRRALAREDLAAAANLLQRALDRDPESDVLWELAEALLSAGDTGPAADVIARLSGPRGEVLAAQLAVLTGTGSLEQTLGRVTAGTEALAAAGEAAAEAKGHHVTAQVQAQLGRVADVETSLDRALLAARKADDRRRITAVLAAAPRAALWGPSPVVRASGRCLDVVRILRMTPGNRHVEAVALRCQAVLEAMRGRADAAREILAGGRATLEELGLTLELHELAMHAGIVELLAGQPESAEGLLRMARDGFGGLGLSVSAAQAAALLARALIEQDLDEEALAETKYAEEHAGGDLKTTITWLGVRAEALARRGETNIALELARRAVALADPTDALADKADANMALARVLQSAGQPDEARKAADAARALYEAKDHSVGAQNASELAQARAPRERVDMPARGPAMIDDPELAAFFTRYVSLLAARDIDAFVELHAPGWVLIDHRQLGWGEQADVRAQIEPALEGSRDLRFDIDEVIACAPGVVACRAAWRGHSADAGGEFELPGGLVATVRDGLITRSEIFEPDAEISIRACFEDLRGRMLLGDSPPERWWARFIERFGQHDRAGMGGLWSQDVVLVDRRALGWEETHGLDRMLALVDSGWAMAADIRIAVDEVLASDDHVIALRFTYVGSAADGGGPIEIPVGQVNVFAEGRGVRGEQFDHDDRDGMLAGYRELGGTLDVLGDRPPELVIAECKRRFDAHDLDGLLALYHEDWTFTDQRQVGGEVVREPRALFQTIFDSSPDISVDIQDVIACDERVIAFDVAYRGTSHDAGGGEFELRFFELSVVEDGRVRSTETFDPNDRSAVTARWRELHGLGLLGDRPPERWWGEFKRRVDAHDLDGLLELYHEDWTMTDHRQVGADVVRDPRALFQTIFEGSPDLRVDVDDVMACGERVIALAGAFRGSAHDAGGGEFEVPFAVVSVIEDGLVRSTEAFDPDDRIPIMARWRELHGLGLLGELPPERGFASWVDCYARKDVDGILELIDEDYRFVDRRALGWEQQRGREQFLEVVKSAWRMWDGGRLAIDEVLAVDERTCALRCTYVGAAVDGGGSMEMPVGYVCEFTDHRFRRVEQFEHDDTEGMLARYRELGGTVGVLGGLLPERMIAEHMRRFNGHEPDRVAGLATEDFIYEDHRPIPIGGHRGRESYRNAVGAVLGVAPDIRMRVDEVLACDDHVIALRALYGGTNPDGGGAAERSTGEVWAVRDGQLASLDHYDPDDRQAMIARYAELGGGAGPLGDTPPEKAAREWVRVYGTGDVDRSAELVSEDFVLVDHSRLRWEEIRGRDAWLEVTRTAISGLSDLRAEVNEVLASGDHAMALVFTWRGTASPEAGGGPFELTVGEVRAFEDGRFTSVDVYDPDDRDGMVARYRELGGTLVAAAARAPELWLREFERRWNSADRDQAIELFDEDFALTDHRQVALWGEVRGRAAQAKIHASSDARLEVDEVLACDDHLIVSRIAWRGDYRGGEHSTEVGSVSLIRNGLHISMDVYDPDDRAAMIARYVELGGGLSKLGNNASERFVAEFARRFAARELDALVELMSDDYVQVDHRKVGWTELDKEQNAASLQSVWKGTTDCWVDVDEILVADDRAFLGICVYRGSADAATGGGQFEYPVGFLLVTDGDRCSRVEWFDPDDREAMLRRYRELSGAIPMLGDRPPERWFAEFCRRWDAHDLDALMQLYAEDWAMTDHRSIGLWHGVSGPEAQRELMASVFSAAPDARFQIDEVLACDDRVIALGASWYGSLDGAGGESQVPVGAVSVIEDGRHVSMDVYEPEDRRAMIARYVELGGGLSALGDSASEQGFAEYARRYAARDLDQLLAVISDDWVQVDHRKLGWDEMDKDGLAAAQRAVWEGATDIRVAVDEVLAADDRVFLGSCIYIGSATSEGGGGRLEYPVGFLAVWEGELCKRVEWFDPDDREAMIARYAELGGGQGLLGDRPPARWWSSVLRAYARRDIDQLVDLYAKDWQYGDHRQLGWEDMRGRTDVRDFWQSALAISSAGYGRIDEVLACDDRVIAVLITWHGRDSETGGEFAIQVGNVSVIEGGVNVRQDQYEYGDTDAVLARYHQLTAGDAVDPPLSGTTVERLVARYLQLIEARDLDAIRKTLADEVEVADHRAVAAPPGQGPEAALALMQSALAITEKLRFEIGEKLESNERAVAYRGSWVGTASEGQGELTLPMALVVAVAGERVTSLDLFEHDDLDAIRARFTEVSTPSPGERIATDVIVRDRRGLPKQDLRGIDAYRELIGQDESELVRAERDLRLERHGDMLVVGRLREGLLAEAIVTCAAPFAEAWMTALLADMGSEVLDAYPGAFARGVEGRFEAVREPDRQTETFLDEDDAIARAEELAGIRAWMDMARNFVAAINSRDWDAFLSMYADDYVLVDHRLMGWGELQGPEKMIEVLKGTIELAPSAVVERIEMLDFSLEDGLGLVRQFFTGEWDGGAYEIAWDSIMVIEDGRFTRGEVFGLEQLEATRARMAELRSGG